MDIPNNSVGLVALSSANGKTIDSRWNSTKPGPKATKTGDVFALDGTVNVGGDQVPIITVMTRDGAVGQGQVTATATVGGVAIGPLTFDVNVIAATAEPTASAPESSGGLTATLLRFQKKPNSP